ncbi:chromosome-partitioning protein Spo0J [bacterium BMS3Abin07]|nr:chromosome-partitioning protein Spo0J [bacterium BMS3Abin07]GBE31363.1 chromosome-partitioning protein Spo0J [bacterium BMS3Bbin05]HDL20309.1 ParB/RepB/Spo0J family partition protein [Nitrospirota bacterium]HDO22360.1 ParB/RepB/Spo0J family partition protein [Nitrospirota bacterium]HDZ88416.1 ParB/RepB/Spo0J family partition protein [Nitrospirota bacterium]
MKTALGRGLDALIPEKGLEVENLQIARIVPNSRQPRKKFRDSTLEELALSIKERGVIQPVIVSKKKDGTYALIAGERRWRAASIAGLDKIPAIVKRADEKDSLEIALIENIQREDLNPIEMAASFDYLLNSYGLKQEELSEKIGKDRATISNYIRLLKLPDKIKQFVSNEDLSMGHARALLSIGDKKKQLRLAGEIIKKGLSVRETEELINEDGIVKKRKGKSQKAAADPHVEDLENRLRESLGTKVRVKDKGKKGKIEIEYYSLEELDRILEILL